MACFQLEKIESAGSRTSGRAGQGRAAAARARRVLLPSPPGLRAGALQGQADGAFASIAKVGHQYDACAQLNFWEFKKEFWKNIPLEEGEETVLNILPISCSSSTTKGFLSDSSTDFCRQAHSDVDTVLRERSWTSEQRLPNVES
eukprot:CAMPEP_0206378612 /NCGR_PEP_ID=MMETSP0294-20121207/10841_1 /ASSEMBLY_ACC=CAM_ASM_000327 /TAXON_ID=39354 /ORGANISM="Heterosigma akashiwo, Strain CCMP2393" /LENGTH=144 /DNA_ID=CAMNT_0053827281 /DNA_START=448 /DNA_END=879 /DNA_ORIENTATION=+